MKAVKKFKNAIAPRRPSALDSIFGKDTRIVQPPLPMSTAGKPPLFHKARSIDTHDRRPVEQVLATEGVHRDIDLSHYEGRIENREDTLVMSSPKRSSTNKSEELDHASPEIAKRDLKADPSAHRPSQTTTSPKLIPHQGKGQAHDPLLDQLYLNLGPGGSSRPPSPPAVSESPPAAETDIYEIAYRKEVDRIRETHGRSATLFVTRRVEKMEDYLRDQGLIRGNNSVVSKSMSGLSKVIETARANAAKDTSKKDQQDDTHDDDKPVDADASTGADRGNDSGGGAPHKEQRSGLGPLSKLVDQARSMNAKEGETEATNGSID